MAEGAYIVVEYLTRDVVEEGMPTLGDLTCIRMDGIITDLEAAHDIARAWSAEARHSNSEIAVFEMESYFGETALADGSPAVYSAHREDQGEEEVGGNPILRITGRSYDA